MVWINKIIFLLFLLFLSKNIYSTELSDDEKMLFSFIDLNNDGQISPSEIDQSVSLIFQIIDLNQDGFISKTEVSELTDIIDSLR